MYDRVCQMNEKLLEIIDTNDGSVNSSSWKIHAFESNF